ncbi:MAG: VOC family protein [Desulfuromonadia bacterium]
MVTGFKNVVIFVKDLDAAKSFYRDRLRLPLAAESVAMMEFFPGAPTTLGVSLAMTDDAIRLVGRHTGITLTVSGLRNLCDELSAAGVQFAEPFVSTPWGTMAVVMDPDGNQIALVEQ